MFYVLRAVEVFDFGHVVNKTNKFGDQGKECHAVVHTKVFDVIECMTKRFAPNVVAKVESL
jgi:hypothetical protein